MRSNIRGDSYYPDPVEEFHSSDHSRWQLNDLNLTYIATLIRMARLGGDFEDTGKPYIFE